MSIDMLPDDVLLEIFDFFVRGEYDLEAWQRVVHVCRRWRRIVFGSPRRLDLRLVCSDKTPARDTLDIWPALPLSIECEGAESVDNILAVLEHSDRVFNIFANLGRSDLEQISAAMQVPFPELTHLVLQSNGEIGEIGETVSALPDSFLGGSAPRLERLALDDIPFPGLPKLLLSATHLHALHLNNIPHSGYISPESIVTALSTLTRLDTLWLEFESPQSRPDPEHQHPPPPTRSVLPNLEYFQFKGDSEYLEVVVAHIDAPQLFDLRTTLFNDIVFDTPQLTQFISRTLRVEALEKAHVIFEDDAATVELSSLTVLTRGKRGNLRVMIPCSELDWQVSSMEQVYTSCLPPLPTSDLHIIGDSYILQHWQGNVENALWLRLLHPFTSVKNLYLSGRVARRIVPALQDLVGDRATEVLPTLQNIFLEGRRSREIPSHINKPPARQRIHSCIMCEKAFNRPSALKKVHPPSS